MEFSFYSPVTIRFVTMLVLVLSDLDVVSTVFVCRELWIYKGENGQRDLIGTFFCCAIFLGFCVYLAAVCYFGPRKRLNVVKEVQEEMTRTPNIFIPKEPEGERRLLTSAPRPVLPSDRIFPRDRNEVRKFSELKATKEDELVMKEGLAKRGLEAVWTAIEMQNAKNRCEMIHGLPFLRTAAFSFQAAPTANDLGCILNGNAAYTLCCGVLALGFGAVTIGRMVNANQPFTLTLLIPLTISQTSFVLSAANVYFDFPSMLCQIDQETRDINDIQARFKTAKEDRLQQIDRAKQEKMMALDQTYPPGKSLTDVEQSQSQIEGEKIVREHVRALQQESDNMLFDVLIRIDSKRKEIEAIRKVLKQKTTLTDPAAHMLSAYVAAIRRSAEELDKQIMAVGADYQDGSLQILQNDNNLSQDELSKALEDLKAMRDLRLQRLQDLKTALYEGRLQRLQDLKTALYEGPGGRAGEAEHDDSYAV